MALTRSNIFCPVFGAPVKFKSNMLPTYADVIRYYLINKAELMTKNKQDPPLSDACHQLIRDLESLWKKSSLPIISNRSIFNKIKRYHAEYRNIKKRCKRNGKLDNSKKVATFRDTAEKNYLTFHHVNVKTFQRVHAKLKFQLQKDNLL